MPLCVGARTAAILNSQADDRQKYSNQQSKGPCRMEIQFMVSSYLVILCDISGGRNEKYMETRFRLINQHEHDKNILLRKFFVNKLLTYIKLCNSCRFAILLKCSIFSDCTLLIIITNIHLIPVSYGIRIETKSDVIR